MVVVVVVVLQSENEKEQNSKMMGGFGFELAVEEQTPYFYEVRPSSFARDLISMVARRYLWSHHIINRFSRRIP